MVFNDKTYFQTTFYYFFNGQIATNIRTWQWVAGVPGQPTNTAKVDDALIVANLPGLLQPLLTTGVLLQGIRYVPVPNTDRIAPIYSNAIAAVGNGGAIALPKQATALCRFKADVLGKSGENRIYIPFPPAFGNETTGELTVGYIGLLIDLATFLSQPQVCNSTTGAAGQIIPTLNVKHGVFAAPQPIASGIAGRAWATQRRRGDYGRTNKSPF